MVILNGTTGSRVRSRVEKVSKRGEDFVPIRNRLMAVSLAHTWDLGWSLSNALKATVQVSVSFIAAVGFFMLQSNCVKTFLLNCPAAS